MYCLVLVHLYLAVLKMLFREHLCPGLWRRLGASSVIQPCLTVLHKAFPWYWPVHPDIYGFAMYALYALYCLLYSGSSKHLGLLSMPCMACIFALYCLALAVPKMLFREHLCARFWHRLGLESCWGSGVSEPCPTVRHTAFPRYSGSSQHLWLCPTATHHPFRSVLPCMPLVVPKMLF